MVRWFGVKIKWQSYDELTRNLFLRHLDLPRLSLQSSYLHGLLGLSKPTIIFTRLLSFPNGFPLLSLLPRSPKPWRLWQPLNLFHLSIQKR